MSQAFRFKAMYFCYFIAFGAAMPYLQLFLGNQRGFSLEHVGLLQMLFPIGGLMCSALVGLLADRVRDVRPLMAGLTLLGTTSFCGLYFVEGLLASGCLILVYAGCFAPLMPLMDSLTVHTAPKLQSDYGHIRVWGSAGFLLPNLLLPLLYARTELDYRALFVIFGAGGTLAMLTMLVLPARQASVAPSFSLDGVRLLARGPVAVFTFCTFLSAVSMGAYYSYFSLYLNEALQVRDSRVGMIWTLGPLAEIAVLFYAVPLARRLGIKTFMLLSLGAVALRMGILATTPPLTIVLLSQLLHALTYGGIHSCGVLFIQRIAPPHSRAAAQGSFATVTYAAGSISGIFMGAKVSEAYGNTVPVFVAAALVGLVATVVLLFFFHEPDDARG